MFHEMLLNQVWFEASTNKLSSIWNQLINSLQLVRMVMHSKEWEPYDFPFWVTEKDRIMVEEWVEVNGGEGHAWLVCRNFWCSIRNSTLGWIVWYRNGWSCVLTRVPVPADAEISVTNTFMKGVWASFVYSSFAVFKAWRDLFFLGSYLKCFGLQGHLAALKCCWLVWWCWCAISGEESSVLASSAIASSAVLSPCLTKSGVVKAMKLCLQPSCRQVRDAHPPSNVVHRHAQCKGEIEKEERAESSGEKATTLFHKGLTKPSQWWVRPCRDGYSTIKVLPPKRPCSSSHQLEEAPMIGLFLQILMPPPIINCSGPCRTFKVHISILSLAWKQIGSKCNVNSNPSSIWLSAVSSWTVAFGTNWSVWIYLEGQVCIE